jgi:hypothetical protein
MMAAPSKRVAEKIGIKIRAHFYWPKRHFRRESGL